MNSGNARRGYLDMVTRRGRWRILVAMPILAMSAAAVLTVLSPTIYQTTAVVALNPSSLSVPSLNQSPPYYLMVDSPSHLPTVYSPVFYIELLKGAEVVNAAKPAVPVTIASNSSDRSLIEVTARGSDANLVAQTANTYAAVGAQFIGQALLPSSQITASAQAKLDAADGALAQFSKDNGLGEYDLSKLRSPVAPLSFEKKMELARLLRARDVAESTYLDLARDQARNGILAVTANKPIAIAQPAPSAPVGKSALNVLLGGGLGLLVGVLAAFVMEYQTR
jgi:hypothetical protein